MLTSKEITDIIGSINSLLPVSLKVVNSKVDDNWLYVIISPSESGISAMDAALVMSKIERTIRATNDKVFLILE